MYEYVVKLHPVVLDVVGNHILEVNRMLMDTSKEYLEYFKNLPDSDIERRNAYKLASDVLNTRIDISRNFILFAKALQDAGYEIYTYSDKEELYL